MRFAQRRVTIEGDGAQLSFALDRGERKRFSVSDAATAAALVATLADCPEVGLLPADGGLPVSLTVAENLSLALTWDAASPPSLDLLLQQAFAWCGFNGDPGQLARRRLIELSRDERLRIGLLRFLVRPPELLVVDCLATHPSPDEAKSVAEGIALYHAVHPFRSSLQIEPGSDAATESAVDCREAAGALFDATRISCPS